MISKDLFCRVKDNLGRQQKGPYCIDLVINDFCNLGCFYCSGSLAHNYKDNWSKGILIKVLDSAVKLRIREISLTSLTGEPTVFKDIRFLMEEIKRRGFVGTLLTNGSRLDPEFADFMHRINWDILILSLDSFNPDIQYKLRPSRRNDKYLEKVAEFLGYAFKHNPKLNINLNMVVNNLNYNDTGNYFKKAESYGINNITLLKLARMNNNYEKFNLTENQLMEFKDKLKNINTSVYFNSLEWLGEKKTNTNEPCQDFIKKADKKIKNCYFHFYKVLIDCDGSVLKCNGDPQKSRFNVNENNLHNIYYDLLENYKDSRTNAPCWDICCSPIKALNQEIDYYLEKGMIDGNNSINLK